MRRLVVFALFQPFVVTYFYKVYYHFHFHIHRMNFKVSPDKKALDAIMHLVNKLGQHLRYMRK
jgi:cell division protein FtsL